MSSRLDFHALDFFTVLQKSKLFEPLHQFQPARRLFRIPSQCIRRVSIYSDVMENLRRIRCRVLILGPRDDLFGKVERFSLTIEHSRSASYFLVATILSQLRQRDAVAPNHRRCDLQIRGLAHRRHKLLHEPRRRQRRIALHIHNDLVPSAQLFERLGASFSAVPAIGRGHHRFAAECKNFVANANIVRRDNDPVDSARRCSGLPRPLYQCLGSAFRAPKRLKRFARKSRGRKSGWN